LATVNVSVVVPPSTIVVELKDLPSVCAVGELANETAASATSIGALRTNAFNHCAAKFMAIARKMLDSPWQRESACCRQFSVGAPAGQHISF